MEQTEQTPQSPALKRQRIVNKTKVITYSAVLSALSMLLVTLMPTVDIGITSVTPGSHVCLMLAMMIHPIVAATTALATTGAFWMTGVPYHIVLRAASHLFFVVPGAFLAKKLLYGTKNTDSMRPLILRAVVLNGVTAVLHALFEILAVLLAIVVLVDFTTTLEQIFLVVGLITLAHSTVDFFIAFALFLPLKRAKLLQLWE